jgi:hypothetical protein
VRADVKVYFPPRNRVLGFFDALGLVGILGFFVARFIPIAKAPFWGCILRQTTGWPCLGCGLTRVADRFSHGNIAGAWLANPLGTIFAAVFLVISLWTLLHLIFKVPTPEVVLTEKQARFAKIALAVAVLVNYAFVVVHTKFPHLLA